LAALDGANYAQPVWHCSLRAAPGDRLLSDAEWSQAAAHVMHRAGFAPYGDNRAVRWVAVRHAPDHVHLVVTLARQDQARPPVWNDFRRVRTACQEMEQHFSLRSTAPADRTAARRPTRAETEQATRRHWPEPPRVTLRREVCTAAAGARTEHEFLTRLAQAGVQVRLRYSTIRPGEVTGYAVSLPRHVTQDGRPVWFSGGKLASDLTLPKLRTRWPDASAHDPLTGAATLPSHSVRAALRTTVSAAAHQATGEPDFFARLQANGLLVRFRYSERHPGQVTGYAVTLPGHNAPDGTPRWYGGSRLHDALSLFRLRATWTRAGAATAPAGTPGFTTPERTGIYEHAAHQAAAAADHIRRCSASNPDHGTDAAWAAADLLHTAARALRSPALHHVAASYDRAARPPHGRIPPRTSSGDSLRTAARLLALTGSPADLTAQASALILNLLALAEAVASLRAAQAHAAQAAAARQAAHELYAAWTQAQARHAPPPRARTARPNGAVRLAAADFPTPVAEAVRQPFRPSTGPGPRPIAPPMSPRAGPVR